MFGTYFCPAKSGFGKSGRSTAGTLGRTPCAGAAAPPRCCPAPPETSRRDAISRREIFARPGRREVAAPPPSNPPSFSHPPPPSFPNSFFPPSPPLPRFLFSPLPPPFPDFCFPPLTHPGWKAVPLRLMGVVPLCWRVVFRRSQRASIFGLGIASHPHKT